MADFSCMTLRKDGERVDPVAIQIMPDMVPYLKRQRSRLITGHILVRGQGEPPVFRRVCTNLI